MDPFESVSPHAVIVRIYRVPLADNRRTASSAATLSILRAAPWFFENFHPHGRLPPVPDQIGNRIGPQSSQ